MKEFFAKYKLIILTVTGLGFIFLVMFLLRKKLYQVYEFTMDSFKFSPNVASHLVKLNPVAKPLFEKFLIDCINLGYTPQINSSYRTTAEQNVLYLQDPRNAKPIPGSMHNYGLAIDVQFSKNGKVYGKSLPSKAEWIATGIPDIAKRYGLKWGGDFTGYYDAVHFEYPIKTASQLYAMATKQFGTDINNIKGNELNLA